MNNKKGAVELSMTTIIIIVIGITVLSLGLVWIRNVFADVEETTGSAFELGQDEINEIFGSSKDDVGLSPSEMAMDQGGSDVATLAMRNSGGDSVDGVYADVEAIALGGDSTDDILCAFGDTGTQTSKDYDLESGDSKGVDLIVKDEGASLGTYICSVTVYNLPGGEESTSLVIEIE